MLTIIGAIIGFFIAGGLFVSGDNYNEWLNTRTKNNENIILSYIFHFIAVIQMMLLFAISGFLLGRFILDINLTKFGLMIIFTFIPLLFYIKILDLLLPKIKVLYSHPNTYILFILLYITLLCFIGFSLIDYFNLSENEKFIKPILNFYSSFFENRLNELGWLFKDKL